ncbi:MAG: glycosyltransferase family 25 protein [Aquabacterium sp.]|uniref:glycosyltransferase family 25 protein n=1 Tax=Aquabacterium sp. TaxID=1872578 RepID=UPI003BDF8339
MSAPTIFLINLDRSTDRLAQAAAVLDGLGLKWERVPGIEGAKLDPAWLKQTNPSPAPDNEWFRALTPGEIGCFLSHLKCWQLIHERQLDCALILEDDFAPKDIVSTETLSLLARTAGQWDLLKLSRLGKNAPLVSRLSDQVELCRWGQGPVDGTAYMVSRQGAAKLVPHREHIYRPVDFDFKHHWERDLTLMAARPDFFRQRSHEEAASVIGGRTDYRRYPFAQKVAVYLRKWRYHLHFWLADALGIGRKRVR